MANASPIGIFDSGIGGLTVFKAVRKHLPSESIVYLGDTARVPYGTKSDETVVKYSLQNAAFLEERGVKAVVVACNTASALAIPALRENVKVPVIGVVEPGALTAYRQSKNQRIGIIGTEATVSSNAYGKALHKMDNKVHVISTACSLFVPLVEEGWIEGDIPKSIAARYLSIFKNEDIDVLILGCTHYPLLKNVISSVIGKNVRLVDSGEATAEALSCLLEGKNLKSDRHNGESDYIYVTDVPKKFEQVAGQFLGGNLPEVKRVNI